MSQWQTPCKPRECGCEGPADPYVHLSTVRGNTIIRNITVTAPPAGAPAGAPQVPQNITGWFMWATLKWNLADPDVLAICQVNVDQNPPPGGIVYTNPTGGQAQITFPPSATLNFPDSPVDIYYDTQVQDTFGNIFTVEQGTIRVGPSVTRTTTT